jgi:branched-chain amino acid transport system permease protein
LTTGCKLKEVRRSMSMTVVLSGLTVGSIYALVALQFDLILAATGIFNFAQASYLVLGAFFVYQFVNKDGWPVLVFIPVTAVVLAILCVAQELITIRPLMRAGAGGAHGSSHTALVTTLGAASVIAGLTAMKWGAQPIPVSFVGPNRSITVLGGVVAPDDLIVIGMAIVACVACRLWLKGTRVGLSALAAAEDRSAALLRGVNVNRLTLIMFAISGVIAGLTVIAIAPITYASYTLGNTLVLKAFVALALGGFGVQYGALLGGLLIGLIEAEASYRFSDDVASLLLLGILLAVLLIRPTGILGPRGVRAI